MRLPARQAPTSLAGQLRFIQATWGILVGDSLDALIRRLDLAIGILAEEERALHLRFGGGGDGGGGAGRRAEGPTFGPSAADEPEAFSSDSAWMPRVVLIAKSTYVWLDQLSRTHARDIRTLDAIPDAELDELARWGVTGLWLIGLWERSKASERIKRMRGNADAVASAYSLDDYRIAIDLGGEAAYADLRDRAWARGIRLASDMVPNHMGIDSRWVIEHPEWFLSLDEPPYPVYSFTGPDLSADERVAIVLEDHYWDDSDAAVVFKRVDRRSGATRFVYHGNDGTSFPWNDTAQLDFIDPAVREQVIRAIIDVARHFPIIRFDAAMVLAKKHIQRLWWPEPGTGGGIPSRAEHAISKREFDKRMPVEFWREVVDRVAAEVPGTLLLAEAFWLLEGYFVRTLGMHRVYNSAFMHMLRDEDGAGYRKVVKETIEFDPEILKRYVNFMSNPDEKTAVEQFGKGDKYFGVATVLATLPGLPMLGHGQVQGFGEKYGMEFRRAILDERPDPWLVARHEREIFPLLHRRAWFAESDDFLLYDLVTEDGRVDEEVLAYSNGSGPSRSLVLYHTRFASTSGRIRNSAAYARKTTSGAKRLAHRSLADGLGLPHDPAAFVIFREARTGLEYLRSCREIRERGLDVSLGAYGTQVYWEFREVSDGAAGQWARLARRTGGGRGAIYRRCAARDAARPGARAAARDLRRQPRRLGDRRHGDRPGARRAGAAVYLVPRGGRDGDRRRRRRRAPSRPRCGGAPSACSHDRVNRRSAAAARREATPEADQNAAANADAGAETEKQRARTRWMRSRRPFGSTARRCSRWLALSRMGRSPRAPMSGPRASPGTTTCDSRRRSSQDSMGPASTKARRGPSPTRCVSCSHSRVRRRSAARCAQPMRGCSTPGSRMTSSGSPSGSTAGKASTTSIRIGLRRRSAGPSASTPSSAGEAGPTRADDETVSRLTAAAALAGYRVDRLRADLSAPPPGKARRRRNPRPSRAA